MAEHRRPVHDSHLMKPRPTAHDRVLRLHFEITDVQKRLHELHQRAGMARAVENLTTPFVMPDLDASFEEEHREWKAEQERLNQRFVPGLRRLYFGVADRGLRKELIQLSRHFEEKRLEEAWAEVDEAREGLAKAGKRPNWPLMAAVAGLGAVYLGAQLAGVGGAIGGAVAAFFWGKALKADTLARQKAAVVSAEGALRSAQERVEALAGQGYIFSRIEVESGSPAADDADRTRGRWLASR